MFDVGAPGPRGLPGIDGPEGKRGRKGTSYKLFLFRVGSDFMKNVLF